MIRVTQPEKTIQHYVDLFEMTHFLNDNLLRHLQLFQFAPYTHVYTEQAEQHYLYFLVEGQVQCSHYHWSGKLAVFALSMPFTVIGDVEIMNEETVRSNVIATQPTTMLGIASDVVKRYGANDPIFLRFLIRQLSEKLYKTSTLQANQGLPVINRLAVYLMAQLTEGGNSVILPGKEEFASLMGITPRHLNRVLKEMVDLGIIGTEYPHMLIRDVALLENLACEG
jgi:CRP/FNR family transcriptional regulator, putaive post-exponential-phase nitrogen-starvation regulator